MAKYRKVSPSIWNDAKFRNLSDNAKLTFFMLLTHPQTSSLGSLRAFQEGLAREMKWSLKAFREAFGEVLEKGMVKVDEDAGLIWLPNFMRHNSPESPNVVKSWFGAYEDCPECPLKNEIYYAVKDLVKDLGEGFREAFAKGFGKTMPNQEQEQEQNINIKNPSDSRLFSSKNDGQATNEKNEETVPHSRILAVYKEELPFLVQPRIVRPNIRASIRARWAEKRKEGKFTTEDEGVEYFRKVFRYVAQNDFLSGRKNDWKASFEWLMKAANWDKVTNGTYAKDDRR